MEKIDLQDLTFDGSEKFAADIGEPAFRGRQLFRWINKGIRDFFADERSSAAIS